MFNFKINLNEKVIPFSVYKLTSSFEKLIYSETGKDVAAKDIDQVHSDMET